MVCGRWAEVGERGALAEAMEEFDFWRSEMADRGVYGVGGESAKDLSCELEGSST